MQVPRHFSSTIMEGPQHPGILGMLGGGVPGIKLWIQQYDCLHVVLTTQNSVRIHLINLTNKKCIEENLFQANFILQLLGRKSSFRACHGQPRRESALPGKPKLSTNYKTHGVSGLRTTVRGPLLALSRRSRLLRICPNEVHFHDFPQSSCNNTHSQAPGFLNGDLRIVARETL